MLERFKQYLEMERLWKPGQRWLLAVSGGVDSVVLTHLCSGAGMEVAVAHCNFQLRGEESQRDESFVKALAAKYGLPFFGTRFDTEAFAEAHGLSLQVAARELRYAWFRDLLAKEGFNAIATGHHQDDNVETVLMNFIKGTGITGLRGMLPLREQIARPLLFAHREEIEGYASGQGLSFVEDSSNATDKYNRNFIRHRVIPLLEERYPAVRQNMGDNLSRFREAELLYHMAVDQQVAKLLEPSGKGEWHISLGKLQAAHPLDTLLYELLKPFGFTPGQVPEVKTLMESSAGHWVGSRTHRILRDRNKLILCGLERSVAVQVLIEGASDAVHFPLGDLSVQLTSEGMPLVTDPRIAYLDAAETPFPLLLRPWKPGDYFYPLGMRKKKKLSRFFIDAKLSLAEKERVWILESKGRIVWVLGQRIDERCKVVPHTRELLRLELVSSPQGTKSEDASAPSENAGKYAGKAQW